MQKGIKIKIKISTPEIINFFLFSFSVAMKIINKIICISDTGTETINHNKGPLRLSFFGMT